MKRTQEEQDNLRNILSIEEDQLLSRLNDIQVDAGEAARWKSIARTHFQEGFMALKRALYEGKRVGDE